MKFLKSSSSHYVDARPALWFVLLSHHSYGKLSHTIPVSIGRKRVYFCARCTGIVIGMLIGLLNVNYIANIFLNYPVLILVFTLPAIIDWLFQVFEVRDSTNLRRVITGTFVGQTYIVGLAAIAKGWFSLLIDYAIVYAAYTIILYILFKTTGVMKNYLTKSWPVSQQDNPTLNS